MPKIQTSVKNRIHVILAKHNIHHGFSDLFNKSGREFLKTLSLQDIYRKKLDGYLEVLDKVAEIINRAKRDIERHCRVWPEANLLTSAPGIGHITGLMLAAEISDIKRFPSVKKFCCYGGLASSTHQSANTQYNGHIIKEANKYIRFAVLEAVPHAIKQDPKLFGFYKKIERAKGKKRARIAVARKILVAIYYMLKNNMPYKIGHEANIHQVNPRLLLGANTATL